MFVVEIVFKKTNQPSEVLYVRRPHFIIGSSQDAHVVVEEMASVGYSLHFVRGKGNSFVCYSVSSTNDNQSLSETFYTSAKLDLDDISLYVVQIDTDLLIRNIDVNPKNILKNIRKAALSQTPFMPAIIIFHEKPVVCSIEPATEILLGRSKDCHIRVDANKVDNVHCKIMYENMNFWIEDCASQFGTFVGKERITKRVMLPPGKIFSLGGEINIMGVNSQEQLASIKKEDIKTDFEEEKEDANQYPCLISNSPLVRPNRIVLSQGKEVLLGRAPENDIWIGSPHISRIHLKVLLDLKQEIILEDKSSNGTVCDGMLIDKTTESRFSKGPHIIDFGDSITVGICYSKEDEEIYKKTGNSIRDFLNIVALREMQKQKEAKKAPFVTKKVQKYFNGIFDFYNVLDKKGKTLFGVIFVVSIVVIILFIYLLLGYL